MREQAVPLSTKAGPVAYQVPGGRTEEGASRYSRYTQWRPTASAPSSTAVALRTSATGAAGVVAEVTPPVWSATVLGPRPFMAVVNDASEQLEEPGEVETQNVWYSAQTSLAWRSWPGTLVPRRPGPANAPGTKRSKPVVSSPRLGSPQMPGRPGWATKPAEVIAWPMSKDGSTKAGATLVSPSTVSVSEMSLRPRDEIERAETPGPVDEDTGEHLSEKLAGCLA